MHETKEQKEYGNIEGNQRRTDKQLKKGGRKVRNERQKRRKHERKNKMRWSSKMERDEEKEMRKYKIVIPQERQDRQHNHYTIQETGKRKRNITLKK